MKTLQKLLLVAFMIATFGLSPQNWTLSSTNIYNNNTGFVGIGTSQVPSNLLHVARNMTGPQVIIQNLGGTGGAGFTMIDGLSGANWKFKATSGGGFKIRDHASALDVFVIEKNSMANTIYIDNNGNIGLGTNNPEYYKLDIRGDLQLLDSYPFITLNNTSPNGNGGLIFEVNHYDKAWLFYDDGEGLLRINADENCGYRNDFIIHSTGEISIGTTTIASGYKMSVFGKVACEEVLVQNLNSWPDYVFGAGYNLMNLNQLEKSINQNKHLPGIPSATEVEENGFSLGEMQRIVLEKVEELTLYTIEQGKQINDLQNRIKELEKENNKLKK